MRNHTRWRIELSDILFTIILSTLVVIGYLFLSMPELAGVIVISLLGIGTILYILKRQEAIYYLVGLFLPYQIGLYVAQLMGITFSPQLILSLLIVAYMIFRALSKLRVRPIPFLGWWLLFIILSVIAYLKSPLITGPIQGIWVIYRLVFVSALLYPAFWWFLTSPQQIRTVLVILSVSAALSGLIAVIQTISHGNLLSGMFTNNRFLGFLFNFPPEVSSQNPDLLKAHFYYGNIFRAHGTFYRANGFGAFMSIVTGLNWGLLRGSSSKRHKIGLAILFVLLVAGTIATFSRSAWAAMLVALTIAIGIEMLFLVEKNLLRKRLQLIILVLVVLGGLMAFVLTNKAVLQRFTTILNPNQADEFSWRKEIWAQALINIQSHPWFGSGTSTVIHVQTQAGEESLGAHNIIVGIAYELGIPALFIFLFLVWVFYRNTWKWFRLAQDRSAKVMAASMMGAMAALFVAGIGGAILGIENIAILFWFMLAASVKFARLESSQLNLQSKSG